MEEIKEIYREIIFEGYYDEKYGMNPQMIDKKNHGVCIDFSRALIKKLRELHYQAGLISTKNDDGFLHAAVLYRDIKTGEVYIADPVTDIRNLTGLSDKEREEKIQKILEENNWKRDLREYIKEFGVITSHNDDLSISMENIQDKEQLEAVPAINEDIPKKVEPIQVVSSLEHLKNVADGPTLLACQALYKKGISTYCSNYTPDGDVSININYNSLSFKNKQILQKLKEKYPDNFYFKQSTGFYGELGHDDPIDENKAMEVVVGFQNSSGKTRAQINLEMYNLISGLEKQEYLQDSYTREQMLEGKHLLKTTEALLGNPVKCKSSSLDSDEQIAQKEGFIFSKTYNRFFKDMVTKSRYIESIFRSEHDLRSEEEIAKDSGVFYDSERKMFFETEKEKEEYNKQYGNSEEIHVTKEDIAQADMIRKIPQTKIKSIIDFFQRLFGKIR